MAIFSKWIIVCNCLLVQYQATNSESFRFLTLDLFWLLQSHQAHICTSLNIQIIWCSLTITHFEKLANFRYIWTPPLSIFLVFTKSVTTFVTILSLKICHVTLQELENVQFNPNPNPNSSPWIKPIKPACNCAHYPISVAFLIMWFSIWIFLAI